MRRPGPWSVFLLLSLAGPAGAFFQPEIRETLGSRGYVGTFLAADFGARLHLKPSLSSYRSDVSSGSVTTLAARLGYDAEGWGAGLTVGGTPESSGYASRFFGVDGMWELEGRGSGPDWSVGGGLTHKTHTDKIEAGGRRRPGGALSIGQTQVEAFADADWPACALSLSLAKFFYDRDLAAVSARLAQAQVLPGLAWTLQGFPNASASVRLEAAAGRWTPFISVTRTSFVLQPASHALGLGTRAAFGKLRLDASYELYTQSGQKKSNYYSLGAQVNF